MDDLNKSKVESESSGTDNLTADALAEYIRGQQSEESKPVKEEAGQSKEDTQAEEGQTLEQPEEAQDSEKDEGFDPTTLPPELQKVYKKMQASFTPKLQEAAEFRRLKQQLEENPKETVTQLQQKYLKQENAQTSEELTEFEQALSPEQRKLFNDYFQRKTDSMIKAKMAPLASLIYQDREQNEIVKLSKQFGSDSVRKYLSQMKQLRSELPGLTNEEAFAICRHRDTGKKVVTNNNKNERTKAYSETPSGGSLEAPEPDVSKMSADELAKLLPRAKDD